MAAYSKLPGKEGSPDERKIQLTNAVLQEMTLLEGKFGPLKTDYNDRTSTFNNAVRNFASELVDHNIPYHEGLEIARYIARSTPYPYVYDILPLASRYVQQTHAVNVLHATALSNLKLSNHGESAKEVVSAALQLIPTPILPTATQTPTNTIPPTATPKPTKTMPPTATAQPTATPTPDTTAADRNAAVAFAADYNRILAAYRTLQHNNSAEERKKDLRAVVLKEMNFLEEKGKLKIDEFFHAARLIDAVKTFASNLVDHNIAYAEGLDMVRYLAASAKDPYATSILPQASTYAQRAQAANVPHGMALQHLRASNPSKDFSASSIVEAALKLIPTPVPPTATPKPTATQTPTATPTPNKEADDRNAALAYAKDYNAVLAIYDKIPRHSRYQTKIDLPRAILGEMRFLENHGRLSRCYLLDSSLETAATAFATNVVDQNIPYTKGLEVVRYVAQHTYDPCAWQILPRAFTYVQQAHAAGVPYSTAFDYLKQSTKGRMSVSSLFDEASKHIPTHVPHAHKPKPTHPMPPTAIAQPTRTPTPDAQKKVEQFESGNGVGITY